MKEDSTGAELIIMTANDNNTLCLACHATYGPFADIPVEWVADYENNVDNIAAVVTQHTMHDYDPEGTGASRCSKCHMPKAAKSAINYDIHSHTFEPIPPQKTQVYQNVGTGMLNACAASCHMKEDYPNFGIDIAQDNFSVWNEPTDLAMADTLMHYYGPQGIWWEHDITTGVETAMTLPETFALQQNYPNPFNPTTTIEFAVPQNSHVQLVLFDAMGRTVQTLVEADMPAGNYHIVLNGANLASGVYFYRLKTDQFVDTKKMVLMK